MRTSRRSFIRQAAVGAASPWISGAIQSTQVSKSGIPAHSPVNIPGVHAYANRESVRPGDTIQFYLSNEFRCETSICRLGTEIDSMERDETVHRFPTSEARTQPIYPGSYVGVMGRIDRAPNALSLECWVRPWSVERLQGVITQEDKESDEGFALGLGQGGYVGFFLGNGIGPDEVEIHRSPVGSVQPGQWSHLVAVWTGEEKQIWVNGVLRGIWPFAGPFRPGKHPFRLGAMGQKGRVLRFLEGDLAMAVVYVEALSPDAIRQRYNDRGLTVPKGGRIWACWDYHEETGTKVADVSGNGRHGRIINEATWMVGGPSFNAAVDRFEVYHPNADSQRGHGLRLASDDLYDCGWDATHHWKVPKGARAGVYTARFRYTRDGVECFYHVPFVVRRPRSQPAKLLVLCSTNTWRAYNAAPFGHWPATLAADIGTGGLPNPDPALPAFSFYRGHRAGQGTYRVGRRTPWPAGSPYAEYGASASYSHLLRAERYLQAWLEQSGYEYDLATDLDLHFEPALLAGAKCVVINGHSEYWSIESRASVDRFLRQGGNLAILSGNSIFWRITNSADGRFMECRKVDAPGFQATPAFRGECWHSDDGLRGGLLRDCGYPGWAITGLETLGWNDTHKNSNFGPYQTTTPDHFLFHQPHETGLHNGEQFGFKAGSQLSLANGHEIDIRLSTLKSMQTAPNPHGGVIPADPSGITVLAEGIIPWPAGGSAFDFFFREIHPTQPQGAEMIYWERPEGGRVFNAGSIGAGWAIYHDAKFQALFRNVLHHFGIESGAV